MDESPIRAARECVAETEDEYWKHTTAARVKVTLTPSYFYSRQGKSYDISGTFTLADFIHRQKKFTHKLAYEPAKIDYIDQLIWGKKI